MKIVFFATIVRLKNFYQISISMTSTATKHDEIKSADFQYLLTKTRNI